MLKALLLYLLMGLKYLQQAEYFAISGFSKSQKYCTHSYAWMYVDCTMILLLKLEWREQCLATAIHKNWQYPHHYYCWSFYSFKCCHNHYYQILFTPKVFTQVRGPYSTKLPFVHSLFIYCLLILHCLFIIRSSFWSFIHHLFIVCHLLFVHILFVCRSFILEMVRSNRGSLLYSRQTTRKERLLQR